MASERPPKKSETIEVRVDHETKSALQTKARAEGRSVSDVLRALIARYLAGAPGPTWRSVMRYSSVVAGVVAVFAASILFVPNAGAHDVTLGVTARVADMSAFMTVAGPEARFEATYGQPTVLCVPRGDPTHVVRAAPDRTCAFDERSGYIITVWLDPAASGEVRVTFDLERPGIGSVGSGPDGRPTDQVAFGRATESITVLNGAPLEPVHTVFFVDRP